MYFKGDWQTPFDKSMMGEEYFYVSSAQIINAPMMHRSGDLNYLDVNPGLGIENAFQALEIPYKNKELSMIVFLPLGHDGLSAFEQAMSPAKMDDWLSHLRPVSGIQLTLPKFKMEAEFKLNETLDKLGMRQAFDGKTADFTGMVSRESMHGDGNLYISAVIHKAYVG